MNGDVIRLAQIARAHGHHATVRSGYVTVWIQALDRNNVEFYAMFDVSKHSGN